MIKLYVDNIEVDFFADESLKIVKTIKNLTDISKVYTTFSQGFTVPASKRNNRIFQHFYRDDLQTTISGLKRLSAFITINGLLFENGAVQIEGATIVNGSPRDYKLGFYGNASRLKEYAGNDTLKDLDLSAYNHSYEASVILDGFGSDSTGGSIGLSSGAVIYPLFSPVRNWIYNSANSNHEANNIAHHNDHGSKVHGVHYYEPKPALQVTKILDAIEALYGITFTGSFLSSSPFTELFIWLHNREGYTFEGVDAGNNQGVVVEPFRNWTHSITSPNITASNTTMLFYTGVYQGIRRWDFTIEFSTINNPCYLYLYQNGTLVQTILASATGTPYVLSTNNIGSGTNTQIKILIGKTTTNLTVEADYILSETSGIFAIATDGPAGTGAQTSTTYTESVVMSNLIPDLKITEFLNGLIKMYNLIVTSTDGTTFNFETYDSFYGSGNEIDLDRWIDSERVSVNEVPRYGALEFKYNESDQVLQAQYRSSNGRGYGDLTARFNFDTQEVFSVEVPFDLPFTELLTDEATGTDFTDFTVYKSITVDENGAASSYYGAPVLFYKSGNINIEATPIGWLDESNNETEIVLIPFCQTVDSTIVAGSNDMCFSEEVNPYLQAIASESLYSGYWSSFINATYNQQAKVFKLSAYINLGLYSRLGLNDTILWHGKKYIINSLSTDFKTGKSELELITKV